MAKKLISPLGGFGLRPLLAPPETKLELLKAAVGKPSVSISRRAWGDLVMMGIGGFTPLEGFMKRADWESVCRNMTLADGTFWPMPVVLDVSADDLRILDNPEPVLLSYQGRPVGFLETEDIWRLTVEEVQEECRAIFCGQGPDSANFEVNGPERHPGVRHVMGRKRLFAGGRLTVLDDGARPDLPFKFMLTPAEMRALAEDHGWGEIACLQLRNPPHRSHEYLARIGLETSDALLIHTPMGELKPGDLPVETRLKCLGALVGGYLPADRTIVAGYPLDMRYAGPREALLHAAFRQNYGVSAQIVGRDHAGVGDFYAPFESQEIFDRLPENPDPGKNLLTRPLKIKWPFYCKKCDSMASLNTCPHSMEDRIFHSGSLLRKCFSENTFPPPGLIRPEIFDILAEHYRNAHLEERIIIYGAADGGSLKKE